MRVAIRDPQGITHVVALEDGRWHGFENIAHAWEPVARQAVIEQVLIAAQFNRALPWGFTYAT